MLDTPASDRELVLTRLMGLFFDITLGLLAVTEGPNYVCCARKCCTISQPVARHTPSCEQMYSSAASSAPIRCGWPVTNGCTAIAMTRGTVWPSRYSVSNWRFSIASNSGTDTDARDSGSESRPPRTIDRLAPGRPPPRRLPHIPRACRRDWRRAGRILPSADAIGRAVGRVRAIKPAVCLIRICYDPRTSPGGWERVRTSSQRCGSTMTVPTLPPRSTSLWAAAVSYNGKRAATDRIRAGAAVQAAISD